MRRSLSLLIVGLLVAVLAGCGSISNFIAPHASVGASAHVEPIYVASVRARGANGRFGKDRTTTVSRLLYDVSVPSTHRPSQSPRYNATRLNPGFDFVISDSSEFKSADAFGSAVRKAGNGEAIVYVHGFNTSHEDGIFQLAQIGADIKFRSARVLFSWPAQNQLIGYMHDLDSTAFARDSLERVLSELAGAGVTRIVLVGYSMGASLVMETLRQMRLKHTDERVFPKLGGVVLLSPDIDIDLFRQQSASMGGLPQPFIVYASPAIGPLRTVANIFADGSQRLGALPDPEHVADVQMIYVDVTNVPSSRQVGHLPVATAPSMIAQLNAMSNPDLVDYAESAAAGGITGAQVQQFGKTTYVQLPRP